MRDLSALYDSRDLSHEFMTIPEVPAPFVSQYRRSLDSFLQGVFDIGIDS